MSIGDQTTLPALAAPTVLAIGCPPELIAQCAAALAAIGAPLKTCDIAGAATAAAQRQPLAIVLVEDVYAFDPREFDALARDVRATLVKVPDDIGLEPLRVLLAAAIIAALERREGSGVIGRLAVHASASLVLPPVPVPPTSRQNASTVPSPELLRSLREMEAEPAPNPAPEAPRTGVRRRRSSSSSDLEAPPSSHGAGGLG